MVRVGAVVGAALLAACSAGRARPVGTARGVASWYGPGFHGRPTTSGEIYDQRAMTAAHPSWPLGTRVRVTNLDNGRSTEVRINDRGPFVDGRDIDLSYAAARELAMLGPGTCNVRLEPILAPGASLAAVQFAVQVAAFNDQLRAEDYRRRLARLGDTPPASSASPVSAAPPPSGAPPAAYVVPAESAAGRVWRVRVGPYPRRTEAESSAAQLAAAGLDPVIVEETSSHR